jgi:hypothetical protein
VGHERLHTQRCGQGESLLVVRGSRYDAGRVTLPGDFAKEPQCPSLMAPGFTLAGICEFMAASQPSRVQSVRRNHGSVSLDTAAAGEKGGRGRTTCAPKLCQLVE